MSTTSGRLDYDDTQFIKGEYYDTFTVQTPAEGEFYVDLTALGFAGFVRVTSPGGMRRTAEEDYYDGRSIRVGPLRAERGTWTVEVTTLAPEEVGAYDVRVIMLDE